MACCDEYMKFMEEFGDVVVGYGTKGGIGVRILLKDELNFRRCPFCGDRLNIEGKKSGTP